MLSCARDYHRLMREEPSEHPLDVWQEYELRKREIAAMGLPPEEYERAVIRLAEELGL